MDENEFLKAVQERFDRDKQNRIKTEEANVKNRDEIEDLLQLVNSILTKHQVDLIDASHIRFYADFIGNILPPIRDKRLSHLIFDKAFPKPSRKSYYHFTSLAAAKAIISNQSLRLSNLRKRFQDGEFSEFYSDHGMDGYKIGGNVLGIDTSEKSIMSEIFFLSLSGSGSDNLGQSKWIDFGDDGYGVRIEFEVNAKHNDFREVFYSLHRNANCFPMLKELFEAIKGKYGKPFNFTYSSKIGAFYIRGRYANELEYRFLVKRTSDDYNAYFLKPVITDPVEQIAYIELPFKSVFGDFKILSVQPGYNCSDQDVEDIRNITAALDAAITIHKKAEENI